MSTSVPTPSGAGIAQALEQTGLRVTDDARAELDELVARVGSDSVESGSVESLIDAIRDTAANDSLGIVDGQVVRMTLLRLGSYPPWT